MNINNDQNSSNQGGDERAKDYLNNYFNAQFLIEIFMQLQQEKGFRKSWSQKFILMSPQQSHILTFRLNYQRT